MSNCLVTTAISWRQRCMRLVLVCFTLSATLFIRLQSAVLQTSPTSSSIPVTQDTEIDTKTLLLPISRLIEPSLPSHSWFSGDPSCAHLLTRFARPGSLPDARLASFPRSGNTWTRYLLEAATGFVTCGPTYDSEAAERPPVGALPAVPDVMVFRKRSLTTAAGLREAGFIAEHVSPLTRTCIVGKTHVVPPAWRRVEGDDEEPAVALDSSDSSSSSEDASNNVSNNVSINVSSNASNNASSNVSTNASSIASSPAYPLPAVLLVRDPFRSIISMRHLITNDAKLVRHDLAHGIDFSGPIWRRFVEVQSLYWFELADEWAVGPRHTLLVPYERLVSDPAAELRRMLSFLGVTLTPERLSCTLRHVEGAFHSKRHPVVPSGEVFDAATRRLVWWRIRQLDETLTSRGYQPLPLESYAFYQESKTMF